MGPPPPPPPPPPLQPTTLLPSGQRKATHAPRRDNNPVPAAAKSSGRPRVDAEALQHAAARLRKTGYNEPVRGDVPHLPDGRVDREDQPLPRRDWQNGSQQPQLECNRPREEVPPAPAHPNYAAPPCDLRRPGYSQLNSQQYAPSNTTASVVPPQVTNTAAPRAPYDASSFDATPKNLFQTFNNPSSDSFIDRTLTAPADNQSNFSSSYSSYSTSSTVTSTAPPTSASPSRWTSRSPVQMPVIVPPAPQVSRSSYSTTSSSTTTTRRNGTAPSPRPYSPQSKVTTVEWSSPYVPGQTNNTLSDPRSLIRDYATNTFVQEEKTSYRTPSPRQPSPSAGRQQTVVGSRHDQFAKQLRDEGLTASQRAANQQKSPLRRDELPFDANHLYQGSYRGDEVDHLVQKMSTQMRTNVMQSSNVCVSCNSAISADAPGCTALDQIFHVACFKCRRCSKVLAGSSFYNIENDPICEGCYQNTLEKCSKCGQTIADKLLRACGGTYHVDCFTCFTCNKTLDGIPFTVDSENNVFCVPCFHDKFAPRCAVCSQGIVPNDGEKESVRVVAMNKSFHVDCYRCEDCGLQLSSKIEGQGCYPLDSHLYCKTCNSNRLRMMASTA